MAKIQRKRRKKAIEKRTGYALRTGDNLARPVKVMDAETGQLKRWETRKGKPMAVIDNGSLVLTKAGKHMGYRVRNKELVKT